MIDTTQPSTLTIKATRNDSLRRHDSRRWTRIPEGAMLPWARVVFVMVRGRMRARIINNPLKNVVGR